MRGIDVTTSPEEGLIWASDKEQLAYALSQDRVVFTFDDDFLVCLQRDWNIVVMDIKR